MSFVADRFGFPPVVTKQQLVAMAPHVRSECVALMREAGMTAEQIARPLNVRPVVIERLADARHLYRMPKPDIAEDHGEVPATPARRDDGLTRGAFLILKFASEHCFEFHFGKEGLSRELGVNVKVVDVGMTCLLDEGLIQRMSAGIGGKPPHYRCTEAGEKLAALMFNLAAAGA